MIVMSESLVDRYLKAATRDMVQNNRTDVRCPCRKCKLKCVADPYSRRFKEHLLMRGFMDGYTRWLLPDDDDNDEGGEDDEGEAEEPPAHDGHHGEDDYGEAEEPGSHDHEQHEDDQTDTQTTLASVVCDPHVKELLLRKTTNAKFEQLEIDSNTPLYTGCGGSEESRLKVTLGVLQMKAKYNWSDESTDACLEFWKKHLPEEGNTCPSSVAEAKKVVCPLDLPHIKYHACINDCIIYRNENNLRITCPVCDAARFKKGTKKAPRKVVWYFPLTPRLQRYFADPKEAKLMRWHAERKKAVLDDRERSENVVLTHPSDATQWKALDCAFPTFGADARNIRLGVSTDGLNPFSNQSSTHSTWPVFVWIYNLPPWLCMKRKYIHMSMLIQGPKQPGNDINLYLQLLKEELGTLWEERGANTWDAVEGVYFPMRAALITTVQDYLGYGYIACQVCHGHNACVRCMDDTTFLQLDRDPGSSKTVYMGHRRWLKQSDAWRKRPDLFDGKTEPRDPPIKRTGKEIHTLLRNWKECPKPGKKQKATAPLLKIWKAKSVFFELPYFETLTVPHCLDVMHITKNVCESLLGTLFNMPEKTKDGPKARSDLKKLDIRGELHYRGDDDDEEEEEEDDQEETEGRRGKKRKNKDYYCPPSSFTLEKAELDQVFNCLLGVKLPIGYSGKISRYLDPQKQRFSGMKSHDCHVMLTQILAVAIRGVMDKHVRDTLIDLCNFFDDLSKKSISLKKILRMKEEIATILCELEIYFPPAFFDVMVHLLIHIMDDVTSARAGIPTQHDALRKDERGHQIIRS